MFCVIRLLVFHNIPFNQSTRHYESEASKCHLPVFPHFIDLLLKRFQNVILKVINNLWLNNSVSFSKMYSLFETRTWFEPVVTSRSSCWCVPTSRQSRWRSRHSKVKTPWHRFSHYFNYTFTSLKLFMPIKWGATGIPDVAKLFGCDDHLRLLPSFNRQCRYLPLLATTELVQNFHLFF